MEMYHIDFADSSGNPVHLEIRGSGNAEGIIRGLIHGGFKVSVQEVIVPDDAKTLAAHGFYQGMLVQPVDTGRGY